MRLTILIATVLALSGCGAIPEARQQARVDVAAVRLAEAIKAWRDPLEDNLSNLMLSVTKLKAEEAELMASMPERAAEAREFYRAKRDYEETLANWEGIRRDLSKRKIELRIPRNPVTIHEEARLGITPVSPQISRHLLNGMGLGAGGGLVLALLIILIGRFCLD